MIITSKYSSWCNRCGKIEIKPGDRCEWNKAVRGVTCLDCLGTSPPSPLPKNSFKDTARTRTDRDVVAVASEPVLPPALAALDGLETQFVRMAAKTSTPAIDAAWGKYEKVKHLAIGNRNTHEQRNALCTALVILVKAIFLEESAYVV